MFPLLQLGPFAIQLPGLAWLAGVWLSLSLVEREARRLNLPVATIYNLVFYGLVTGIVAARLWYVFRFLSEYADNPLSLFSLNPGTLAPVEGTLTGLVVAVLYGQRQKLPRWSTLDSLALGLALLAIFLGLAHLSSGDAFGAPTSLPWGVELWAEVRHPTQVYESITAAAVLGVIQRVKRQSLFDGFTFLTWTGLAALSRLFLEAFRGDSLLVPGGLRAAQLLALFILMGALWGLRKRYQAAIAPGSN